MADSLEELAKAQKVLADKVQARAWGKVTFTLNNGNIVHGEFTESLAFGNSHGKKEAQPPATKLGQKSQ